MISINELKEIVYILLFGLMFIVCDGYFKVFSLVCIELEMVVLDWLVKMFEFLDCFLYFSEGYGGGVI